MSKRAKFIIGIPLAFIVIVFALSKFICIDIPLMYCDDCPDSSMTVEESKDRGVYLMSYKPLDSLLFTPYGDKVYIEYAWLENTYSMQNCLWNDDGAELLDGYNLVVSWKCSNPLCDSTPMISPQLVSSMGSSAGGLSVMSKAFNFDMIPDTVEFKFDLKNPDSNVGWTSPIDLGNITYVRVDQ